MLTMLAESHADLDKGLPWWVWVPILVGSLTWLWFNWAKEKK